MNRVFLHKKSLSVLLLLLATQAFALNKTGQTGLKFLAVGVGARAAAMGEAFTLVGDDANAVFYNPAGIAYTDKRVDAILHKNYWIADISYNAVALTCNLKNWGIVGVTLLAADYPNSIGTMVADNDVGYIETGDISAEAWSVGLVYARNLTDKFSIGGKIRHATQSLGTSMIPTLVGTEIVGTEESKNQVSGLAYDIGTIFYPGFKSFRVGMSITNFSPQYKYEEEEFQLPLTFKLGVAMDVLDLLGDRPEDMSCVIDVEVVHPRDYSQRLHIGSEIWFRNMVALRGGYKFNYDEEGLTAGIGFNVAGVRIDYAWSAFGVFDSVSRFSCGFAF